jgi:signal transduction histidine kinase/ligand-binding sensor domain-containing protein
MRALSGPAIAFRLALLLTLLPGTSGRVQAQRLPIKTYTTADGLWSSSIRYLMRDSHGFIWFCTRDGLSRFDGYRFVNYKIGNDSSSFDVSYLIETRKGIYWIAINGGGLYRFDPNAASSFTGPIQTEATVDDDGRVPLHAEMISRVSFGAFYEDREGNLWAGCDALLLIEDNNGQVTFRQVELNLPQNLKLLFGINAIVEGQDGSLWLSTNHGLMRRLPDGRVAHFSVHPEANFDVVAALLEDRDGRIWIGHNSGLYVFKPQSLSALAASGPFPTRSLKTHQPVRRDNQLLLPDVAGEAVDCTSLMDLSTVTQGRSMLSPGGKKIWAIYQTSDRRVWIGTDTSLVVFDGQRFQGYTSAQSVVETPLGPDAEDMDGDLWIASLSGPMRLSAQGLTTYDRANGLTDARIQSIYEDHNGSLHVINGDSFISRLDERRFNSTRPKIPLDAKPGWTSNVAFLDHAGEWWFLTSYGLYRFARVSRVEDLAHRQPTALYTERDGLKTKSVYCMFEDSRGDLWISTRYSTEGSLNGLTRWQRSTETFHTFAEADGLPPMQSASSFAEDRAGNLWFGFYQGGLVRYAAGRFTAFTTDDGLPEGLITGLYVDHAGHLWLTSSSGGLSRIDDPAAKHLHFVSYTTKEGLSSNNARCITEDLSGLIYVGTVRGVDRLTPDTGSIKHFTVSDGLASDFVNTAYRDRRGVLWFGTFNGLSRLDPQPDRQPAAPSIMISGLHIAGVKQPLSEFGRADIAELELSAAQNNLQIDFFSLSLSHAALLRYQFKLEGADADWSSPTDQRSVNYSHLSPGAYRFLVRAVAAGGALSESPATVTFKILPPIWQRWWFIASAVLLIGLAIYAIDRYRVARLIELERVRTRIATDLHDDIGSSLSQVSVLSEVVRRRVGSEPSVSEPLSMIADLSRDLVDSMNDIVWAINPRRDHLSDLTQRIRRFASDVLTARDIEFNFSAPEPRHDIRLGADMRREVFLIFKESVNNMVRHSGCTEANIEFLIESGWLELKIRDNGKGFESDREGDGNGLVSMRQRAARIGGTLDISSNNGKGTVVLLRAPLGRLASRKK